MLTALGLFALVEAVGLAAAPITALVLGRLPGAGLGLSKVLGLLLVTWVIWMAGSLDVVSYGVPLVIGVLALLAVTGLLAAARLRGLRRRARPGRRSARLALPADAARRPLFWGAEAVFAVAYALGVLLAAYAPDVWNTEKPMDMGFITALNASSHFPPHDPWMSGETLNYYYFGHLVLAWPLRLLGGPPDTGYLVAWGLLLALTATAAFTFAGTLWAAARRALGDAAPRGGPVAAGVTAGVRGPPVRDPAGVRTWVNAADPPHDYAWFEPSRVIPDTINEFPSFSFLLGDLHAHVLALPFTVLALAFALQVALHGPRGDAVLRGAGEGLAAALAVGALYAINTWSYPVGAGLLVAAVLSWGRQPENAARRAYAAAWTGVVLVGSVVLVLPFILNFDPGAEGVGVVHTRRPFANWLGDMALIYGILLWPLLPAFASRLMRSSHRRRWLGWGLTASLVAGSLLAADDLIGAYVAAVALAAGAVAALSPALSAPERFLWILIAGGAALLLIPELLYLRDAFDHSALFRMNTLFKAGYQAFVLFGLAAACALPWASVWLPGRAWTVWAAGAAVLLLLGLVYPYAGSYARTGGFAKAPSLDGLQWLSARSPGDPGAMAWIRDHTPGDAVVLEAFGDDYSAFGHARISTFTGRPTVIGWAGHELQWSHDPDGRGEDVKTLYTVTDAAKARPLLARYGIRYVVAGPIEQTTYGDAGLAKWDRLGRRVYSSGGTTVWELTA